MNSKNRNFKKLLATICGVAVTLGGGTVSAKNSNVKSAAPVPGNTGLIGYIKNNPLKSSATATGGVIFAATVVFGGKYLLSKGQNPEEKGPKKEDPKKENPEEKNPKEENPEEKNPKEENPKEENPGEKYEYLFNQVKIQNFEKREFLQQSSASNNLADTRKNDVNRDSNFLGMLRDAGVAGSYLSSQNFAAFTSQDHKTTIYVVDARAGSSIRNEFVTKNVPNMFILPNVLLFIGKASALSTDWSVRKFEMQWNKKGMIRIFVDNKELK